MWWRHKRSPIDFSSELQAHIALEADRLRAEGLSEEEARSRAIKNLGNVTQSEERFYESTRLVWLDQLRQDTVYALRQLMQNKSFTVVACATLALGIGANTAIFTLLHAVMFQSLPVDRPGELYRLGKGDNCCVMTGYQDGQDFALFSYDLYKTLRSGMPEITHMAAFQAAPQIVSVRRSGSTEPSQPSTVEYVSSNYFDLFGLRPALGNFFAAGNEFPGAAPVLVLSYRAWQTYYQADPRIVGSTLLVKGEPFTVIGIAPPKFYGETLRSDPPDFWLPLATEPLLEGANNLFSRPDTMWLYVMGRIPAGAHPRKLEAKLNLEATRWYLAAAGSHPSAEVRRSINEQHIPLASAAGGVGLMGIAYRDGLFLLMSLSSLVLLIACANVANLLLARGTTLRAQISLKLALGASRGRITRQAITDSVILSLLGGGAGIAVAFVTARLILLLAFRGARYVPISATPSLPVLIFAFFVSVTTGFLFGIAPAWMQTHSDPADALRGAGRSTPAATSLVQRLLVIAQAALSLVLLTGAGLLTQSLRNLETQHFGFVTDHRVLVSLNPALTGYTAEQLAGTYRNLQDRLGRIPGVIHASLSMYAPMTGNNWNESIYLEQNGLDQNGLDQNGNTPVRSAASFDRISPGYFDTLGTHLIEGRAFTEYDGPSSPRVAVVNRTFVAENFPHRNPIGKRFGGQAPGRAADYQIVGVVEDTKYDSINQPAHPTFFLPLLQMEKDRDGSLSRENYIGNIELYVSGNLDRLEPRVRTTVEQVDSHLAVLTVRNYGDQLGLQFNQQRLIATLTQLFGTLALVLASVGLYGLIGLTVARRTAEIGIRMALGATRSSVVAMILRGAIVQVWLGMAVGVPLTLAGARLIRHQLFQISSYNPATLAAAGLLLLGCAGIAALIPGRRAASIDPMLALRLD